MQDFQPYIPQNVGEIMDHLGFMMLKSPTFKDDTGYFSGRNVETTFLALNEGLKSVRSKLGDSRYNALIALSDQMRAHFEADPADENGEAKQGRELIVEMETLLTSKAVPGSDCGDGFGRAR